MKSATLVGLLVVVLAATPALAGNRILLDDPVVSSSPMKAWGMAERGGGRGKEYLNVRTDVALPNGATLIVAIKRVDGPPTGEAWIEIAKANVMLGTAVVYLESTRHVSPAFPVKGLSEIMVKYKGRIILKGHF